LPPTILRAGSRVHVQVSRRLPCPSPSPAAIFMIPHPGVTGGAWYRPMFDRTEPQPQRQVPILALTLPQDRPASIGSRSLPVRAPRPRPLDGSDRVASARLITLLCPAAGCGEAVGRAVGVGIAVPRITAIYPGDRCGALV